jgi:small-conductance mechanosensitive channel
MISRPLQIALLPLLCGVFSLADAAAAAKHSDPLVLAQTVPPEAAPATPAQPANPAPSKPATAIPAKPVTPPAAAPNAAPPAGAANSVPDASPATPPSDAAADAPAPPDAAEPAVAATPKLEALFKPVNDLSAAIDQAEKQLETAPGEPAELSALAKRVEDIQAQAKSAADALRPRLEEVRAQIERLGKPPADGAPPETREVTAERNRLNGLASAIDGAIKKAALTEERAVQLASRVQHMRQGIFTRLLLWQTHTPFQPDVWRTAAHQLDIVERQSAFILGNWWSVATLRPVTLLVIFAAAALAFFLLRSLIGRFSARWLAASPAAILPRHKRAANALRSTVAGAIPAATAVCMIFIGLNEAGLLFWQVERFAQAVFPALLLFIGVSSLAYGALQPDRPRWRVFDLDDTAARRIYYALSAIAAVYALDLVARSVIGILSLSPTASIVSAFIASLVYSACILLVVCTPFRPLSPAPGAPVSAFRRLWLKAIILAIGAVLLATALLGFVALTRFVAGQLLVTGSCLLIVALAHFAIGGVHSESSEPAAEAIGAESGDTPDDLRRVHFARAIRIVLNILLIAVAVPLILMTWGIAGADVLNSLKTAISGFEIGGVRISLLRIFLGLLLFVALVVGTRFLQRWLASNALPRAHIEVGLANSIYTGVGYIGFAVAVLAAVSYAGFDITSLAIVAGALSVGIGFGLQGIVNNFVSGLVLLVERPIKVGDWIALKDGQGYVRRISVRATEIETFDRASLIVPNSELITQIVTNRTHRNQLGRLNISVRIAYSADPEVAAQVLREVAAKSTMILRYPAPIIVLDNLGDQAMEFSVRVYLADINRSLDTQTELRSQIVNALRKAGIDIPYFGPQIGHASGPRASPERISVPVRVSLGSDPDAVLDALSLAARRCTPKAAELDPQVAFDDIGEQALQFSVSLAVPEGESAAGLESALRAAAVKALRTHGIDLPGGESSRRSRDELYRAADDEDASRSENERSIERSDEKPPLRKQ